METLIVQTAGAAIAAAVGLQAVARAASAFTRAGLEARRRKTALDILDARLESVRRSLDTAGKVDLSWNGWRKFEVRRRLDEGGDICSFYLAPHDGKPIPDFKPGQYLTFQLNVPGQSKPVTRCYSLSDCYRPGIYRVSIKRCPAPKDKPEIPAGLASNHFHDNVKVGDILDVKAPSGKFHIDMTVETPVVLIAGGIGITPLLSMLNAIVERKSKREVWFFYGVRDDAEHICREHLESIARDHENVNLVVCYSRPREKKEEDSGTRKLAPAASQPAAPAALVSEKTGEELPLLQASMTVGRKVGADIVIPDKTVSSNHARVFQDGDTWFLEDTGSTNGTYLNGAGVSGRPVQLNQGDRVAFGEAEYIFQPSGTGRTSTDLMHATMRFTATALSGASDDSPYIVKNQRVTVGLMQRLLPSNNYDFYICGPGPLVEQTTTELADWGVPEAKVHYEAFGPSTVKKAAPPAGGEAAAAPAVAIEVGFARSGKTAAWDPSVGSLLDFAEKHGVNIDFGCRAGSCGTCKTAIKSGDVNYSQGEPPEAGCCLPCVCVPKGNLVLDA